MERWVFMGNPGSGKSTLLNCLVKRAAFDAGLSFGSGRTRSMQSEKLTDKITVVDTPGVADVEVRQDACDAITAALKIGGVYKLFFVLTLRNGRASPEDVATYNEVLRSISKQQGLKFSLIVNNVEKQQHKLIDSDAEVHNRVVAGLCGGDVVTDSIVFIATMEELDEEDNVVVPLPKEVLDFFVAAPTCKIHPTNVGTINADTDLFRAKSAQIASTMHSLLQQREVLQKQLASIEDTSQRRPHSRLHLPMGRAPQPAGHRSTTTHVNAPTRGSTRGLSPAVEETRPHSRWHFLMGRALQPGGLRSTAVHANAPTRGSARGHSPAIERTTSQSALSNSRPTTRRVAESACICNRAWSAEVWENFCPNCGARHLEVGTE